jgi:RNA polymerase sigma factor (sigma-70 family)
LLSSNENLGGTFMENKNSNEAKFDSYLTKTIIFSSKKYFKKQMTMKSKELSIFDDKDYYAFIENIFSINQSKQDYKNIDISLSIKDALNSLSAIEQAVIFLLFQEELTQSEAAQILEIYSKTVSKIKIRAIEKLKKYFKGDL